MSQERPSEAFDTPIQQKPEETQEEEKLSDKDRKAFYDDYHTQPELSSNDDASINAPTFVPYNQVRDIYGNALNKDYIYCIVKGGSYWDVLEQGSNDRQVKFTNFGRHFSVKPRSGSNTATTFVIKAVNLNKHLAGHLMSGTDVRYLSGDLESSWLLVENGKDNYNEQTYLIYTARTIMTGTMPWYDQVRVGLDSDNEWRSGSIKTNFSVKLQKMKV